MNVVQYKKFDHWLMQSNCHIELKNDDKDRKERDWRNEDEIDPKVDTHDRKLLNTMIKFDYLWDGTFGSMNVPKHQIESKSGYLRPLKCGLLNAALKAITFKSRDCYYGNFKDSRNRVIALSIPCNIPSKNERIPGLLPRLLPDKGHACTQCPIHTGDA